MLQNLTLFSKSVTPGSKIEGDTLGNALVEVCVCVCGGGGGGGVQQRPCFFSKTFLVVLTFISIKYYTVKRVCAQCQNMLY